MTSRLRPKRISPEARKAAELIIKRGIRHSGYVARIIQSAILDWQHGRVSQRIDSTTA